MPGLHVKRKSKTLLAGLALPLLLLTSCELDNGYSCHIKEKVGGQWTDRYVPDDNEEYFASNWKGVDDNGEDYTGIHVGAWNVRCVEGRGIVTATPLYP